MSKVSFLTININKGFSDTTKQQAIKTFASKDDYLLMQETRSRGKVTYYKNVLCREGKFSSYIDNARGAAALCRPDKNIIHNYADTEGRIAAIVTQSKVKIGIISVYMPCLGSNETQDDYIATLDRLDKIIKDIKKVTDYLVIGGDFNCIMNPAVDAEKLNVKTFPEIIEAISDTVDLYDLVDVYREFHPNHQTFTFSPTGSNPNNIFRRLDYFYISSNLVEYVQDITSLHCHFSDHKALRLVIDFQKSKDFWKGYWRHNDRHLDDEKYRDNVKAALSKAAIEYDEANDLQTDHIKKWEFIKYRAAQACRKFSAEKNKTERQKLKDLEKELQELEQQPVANAKEILKIKNELNLLRRAEDEKVIFRSRMRWHEHGEKLSKEFYRTMKENNRDSNVIELVENNIKLEKDDINSEIEKYYQNLLGLHKVRKLDGSILATIKQMPKLNNSQHDQLKKSITISEMTSVLVRKLNPGKSPGCDGLTVAFYKAFWDELKYPLYNCLSTSLRLQKMGDSQRRSVVRLIRKKDKDPSKIKNWRPISLINCDVKILSRLLTARIEPMLQNIISKEQLAYVKNRNIFDGIRFIEYTIDHLEKGKQKGLITSFDMQKAFDSISHSYIFSLLQELNFPPEFINGIKTMYASAESVVLNNGLVTRPILLGRSCRQGDCLSPYLFILAMEPLIHLINNNININGICPLNIQNKISIYADDITGLLKSKEDLIETIRTIEYFGKYSGLKMNVDKTEILPIGYDPTEQLQLHELNVKLVDYIKITGIYFSCHERKDLNEKLNFEQALNKSRNNFNRWSGRNISILGRTLLAKTHGLAQIQFLANCIIVPDWAIKQLKQYIYKFIWKGVDKITRGQASKPVRFGGINLPILDDLVSAAGSQWLRKIHKIDLPWQKFLKEDICKNGGLASLNNMRTNKEIRSSNKYQFNAHIAQCWRNLKRQDQTNSNDFLNQVVWNNRHFAYYNKTRKLIPAGPKLWSMGYNRVGDFFDSDGRIIESEAALRAGLPQHSVIEWSSAVRVIKKHMNNRGIIPGEGYTNINQELKSKDIWEHSLFLTVNDSQIELQDLDQKTILYTIAMNRKDQPKFISNMAISHAISKGDLDLSYILKKTCFVSNNTKFRSFILKICNGLIYSNKELARFGYSKDHNCTFCKTNIDSKEHMLFQCEIVSRLRVQLYRIMKMTPSRFEEWFGTNKDGEDLILLSLNKFIYQCKYAEKNPTLQSFLASIKYEQSLEYIIAEKNNSLLTHFKKWDVINDIIKW